MVVITWPYLTADSTTELPNSSVVVRADITLEAAEDAPRAGADVMMLPPDAISMLASGEVVVTVWPCALTLVMTAAGTVVEVVKVLPREFVVVRATTSEVGAVVSKAEVVSRMTLPAEFVDEITTGTKTPDWATADVVERTTLPAESVEDTTTGTSVPTDEVRTEAADVPAELPETVPAVMAAGVLTIVLPAALVVVTGEGVLAAMTEEITADETMVLPAAFVVVSATVVTADATAEEPAKVDKPTCVVETTEPSDAVESTTDEAKASEDTTVLPAWFVDVTGIIVEPPVVTAAADDTIVLPALLVVVMAIVVWALVTAEVGELSCVTETIDDTTEPSDAVETAVEATTGVPTAVLLCATVATALL